MHTFTVQTKFTFGDRVEYDCPLSGNSRTGIVVGITITPGNHFDYLIDRGEGDLIGGILEHEITATGTES
jgi:hypothetical protein